MRRIPICIVLFCAALNSFAQAGLLADSIREYVGLICVTDHPDLIALVEQIKADHARDTKSKTAENSERAERIPKEPPYERPAGSGFLFKADDGNTYILTNWHVVAHNWSYSITFEKSLDEKAVYTGLTLVAADEESDLALLAFAQDNKPGREGLALLERAIREGEEVFSAGFPALGRDPVWQLSRGFVSNARVMFHRYYDDDEDDTMEGPFIQHTSQVDPGNSGGPLLVMDSSFSRGYAVAGINARSARRRQTANYSIPADTVRAFMEQVLNPSLDEDAERKNLDNRLAVFIKDLERRRFSAFDWITYQCFFDNAEYAFYWAANKNKLYDYGRRPFENVLAAFYYLIGDTMPFRNKEHEITVTSVKKEEDAYTVVFQTKKKALSSRWALENGTWRIAAVGTVDGNWPRLAGAKKLHNNQRIIRDGTRNSGGAFIEGGYVHVLDRGPAGYGAFGFEGAGIRGFFAGADYWQVELFSRYCLNPLRFGVFALGANFGLGMGIKKLVKADDDDWGLRLGISPQLGIQLTSSLVPGLYLGAAYQYNLYFQNNADRNNTRHLFIFLAGYRFKEED